ncbi:hypothetical protein [Chitinophaga ginsengisoli]|uniref:Uncharacterized protein n=1 Tax=Chitinophaga ginsengisoli TaxID=363837 RepID=A0A2P8GQ75_9BACT|nr:hypothetical protein [Chitinophaga ginsengisoli]PSL36113.1 hypothetical protein CLV42_101882 [Chitinophaga ginsengisoli]
MKRIPFSYSTFFDVQEKAKNNAAQEGRTVSTVIHKFLITYTEDKALSSPLQQMATTLSPLEISLPKVETEMPIDRLSTPALFIQTTKATPSETGKNTY